MAHVDPSTLAERLRWEKQDYWLHVEAGSSLEKYPAKQHARRVVEKLGVSEGLIYLPGEPQRNNEDSDMPAPFRQRRYFYYLSGCNEPGCQLTYDIQNDSLALFIPRINPQRVIWTGRGSTPAEAMDKYDIDSVHYVDELKVFLADWASYYRGILYVLHPSQNPWKRASQPVDSSTLQPAMNLARLVKDDHEIRMIRKANDISSKAHRKVLASIRKFKNEAQVEGLFLDVCISERAKEQAYAPIAASGPNAGTLHYDANNEDFEDRQLMCLDAGCEWELYASDITRTFPLSGRWPSQEAKDIYSLVQKMQETCIDQLAPGVRYLDVHILAHQIAIDGLLKLGILHNGTSEEIYKAGTSRAFFPHGLGHHVGLEVHDPGQADLMSMTRGNPKYVRAPSIFPKDFHLPVYDPTTCRSPVDVQSGHLEAGMVVTVEPGIYFSTYALNMFYLPHPVHSKYINTEVVARYLPVGGVRIEDDILITSKGFENLTTAPKAEAMLEIIQSGNPHWPFVTGSTDLGPVSHTRVERKPLEETSKPLLRAPGLGKTMDRTVFERMPPNRAQTLPIPVTSSFKAPLFGYSDERLKSATVKRTSTSDNATFQKSNRISNVRTLLPQASLCGQSTTDITHAHTWIGFPQERIDYPIEAVPTKEHLGQKPPCRKCAILVQTMDRLRTSLQKSEQEALRRSTWPAELNEGPEMSQRPVPETVESVLGGRKLSYPPQRSSSDLLQTNQTPKVVQSVQSGRESKTHASIEPRPQHGGQLVVPPQTRHQQANLATVPSAVRPVVSHTEVLPFRPNPALAQRFSDRFTALREHNKATSGLAARPSLPKLQPKRQGTGFIGDHQDYCSIAQERDPCWPGPSSRVPQPSTIPCVLCARKSATERQCEHCVSRKSGTKSNLDMPAQSAPVPPAEILIESLPKDNYPTPPRSLEEDLAQAVNLLWGIKEQLQTRGSAGGKERL